MTGVVGGVPVVDATGGAPGGGERRSLSLSRHPFNHAVTSSRLEKAA